MTTEMWRLFIAIELPEQMLTFLTEVQDRLKRQVPRGTVRWVAPTGIHLTLKFLGDAPLSHRPAIEDAIQQAVREYSVFDLAITGLGCFPNAKRPRVIWIGIDDQGENLLPIHNSLEKLVAPLGYPTENRPFSPHLTLGRVQRGAGSQDSAQLGQIVKDAAVEAPPGWLVDGVSLIRSELRPSGAVYTQLRHVPLQRPTPPH